MHSGSRPQPLVGSFPEPPRGSVLGGRGDRLGMDGLPTFVVESRVVGVGNTTGSRVVSFLRYRWLNPSHSHSLPEGKYRQLTIPGSGPGASVARTDPALPSRSSQARHGWVGTTWTETSEETARPGLTGGPTWLSKESPYTSWYYPCSTPARTKVRCPPETLRLFPLNSNTRVCREIEPKPILSPGQKIS